MARKPTKNEPGTEVVDWEKQMEEQARIAAEAQRSSGGGGKFFSMQAGVLSFDGTPLPGNQMAVIILADIMENSWYDGPYDPNTPASPKCFAFAKHEDALEPHVKVDQDEYFERQHDTCNGCPRNEWGSAPVGKGKDCKNVMRLSMIPAGVYKQQGKGRNATYELELYDEDAHFAKAEEAFMKLPVMSVKNYSVYVKMLAADVRRPPHGVITNIYLEPDPKSQFRVMFELIEPVSSEYLNTIMQRHKAAQSAIDFPYSPPIDKDEQDTGRTTASSNKLRGKNPVKKGRR